MLARHSSWSHHINLLMLCTVSWRIMHYLNFLLLTLPKFFITFLHCICILQLKQSFVPCTSAGYSRHRSLSVFNDSVKNLDSYLLGCCQLYFGISCLSMSALQVLCATAVKIWGQHPHPQISASASQHLRTYCYIHHLQFPSHFNQQLPQLLLMCC